jgi:hypothetical protein
MMIFITGVWGGNEAQMNRMNALKKDLRGLVFLLSLPTF